MSKIQVNEIVNHFDNGAPDCPKGLTVTGVSTFSGNVSIGGTLSYEDVTNIDSVGIITAQAGAALFEGSPDMAELRQQMEERLASEAAAAREKADAARSTCYLSTGGAFGKTMPHLRERLLDVARRRRVRVRRLHRGAARPGPRRRRARPPGRGGRTSRPCATIAGPQCPRSAGRRACRRSAGSGRPR